VVSEGVETHECMVFGQETPETAGRGGFPGQKTITPQKLTKNNFQFWNSTRQFRHDVIEDPQLHWRNRGNPYILHIMFPIRTDCVTIFLNVVAKGGNVRWNWHITPDLYLATSWLHDFQRGPKVTSLVGRSSRAASVRYMSHFLRESVAWDLPNICVRFAPDSRRITLMVFGIILKLVPAGE
jgi:hypothetical protein